MPDKRKDKNGTTDCMDEVIAKVSDTELDTMLAQWAEADADLLDVEVPEGLHQAVMTRLRQVQREISPVQSPTEPQKKGTIISLAERFAHKKAWMGTAVAAAVVLCCVTILQSQQDAGLNMADAEPQFMVASKMQVDSPAVNASIFSMESMEESMPQDNTKAVVTETETDDIVARDNDSTPEKQLTQLQAQLEDIHNQLNAVPDTAE